MQKGKHQSGQTQGYPPRNYSAYPGNPENPRQYSREVPGFHASGTPGGGPGMRGMHHAPPTQPPTPPTSQDIKQPPAHLPPQAHQMPPQSGGQLMQYPMPGAGRGGTQQTPFYPPSRAQPASQRMAPHPRASMVMSNSPQSFMSQPVVQQVYQGHVLSPQMPGQGPVFVAPSMSQHFQLQQSRHQGGSFYSTTPQILVQPHAMYTSPYPQQAMYYQSIPAMSRSTGPAPTAQGVASQPQPSFALITGHSGAMISNSGMNQQMKSRHKKILPIIDPDNGRNILIDINDNNNTSSPSGQSSARQTPTPVIVSDPDTGKIIDFKNENSSSKLQGSSERMSTESNDGQKTDQCVAAEFATRVALAARVDHSGSPNSPALQSSSRTSNYSENESQASPDQQVMSTPSVSPSKLDTSVDSLSSESQIENNIPYDANQPAQMMRTGWPTVLTGTSMPVEIVPLPPMMMDDMMRPGSLAAQPVREYQALQQPQWQMSEPNSVPVPIIINKDPMPPMESPVRPHPEKKITPVVSATQGPTVDLCPPAKREQFPLPNKGHQQQSPKRKQRLEQTQEQSDGRLKDQQSKIVNQSKHKISTPTAETKKQPTPPSQDSEEYVQSVQTKSSELKTVINKKNDSDSSGARTKSNDSLKNKEINNTLETKVLTEDNNVQDNNNSRNKSENVKCDVALNKESSPSEESAKQSVAEEARENVASPVAVPEPETVPAVPAEESSAPAKANGSTPTEDEGKTSNQKSKPGSKRPAQSKMRLESKELRNAEPETPAVEATPFPSSVSETKNSAPSSVVNNERAEKAEQEEVTAMNEEKEKESLIVATKNEENNKQTTSIKENDTATPAPGIVNKIITKRIYDSDQWSPSNPEGKKKYDKQFIMDLQHKPQSMKKPNFETNFLELLSDNNKQRPFDRNVINSMNRSHVDNIYPSFANKNSSQRGQAIPKRGSQQGKPKAPKPGVVQVTLMQDVKLRETENAWKPARINEPGNMTEEEAETEALKKRVRGILNKLTPENFNKLVAQVKALPINSHTRLESVIDLVFKKAVDEPSFSVAYAQMCSILQKMEVPSNQVGPDGKPEPEKNFRKLLINRCQQEFEKNSSAELKPDDRLKEIEEETDPEKKKLLQLQFEEEERRIRMRSVGNIRFIGELYKLQMLTWKIMHSCVSHLLTQGDEESLECLCKLLTTIGQGLEALARAPKTNSDKKEDRPPDLHSYFKKLNDIVKNKGSGKVSSRVRFMIQDLIDLRNNKWVPRRNEAQPKTIDQIQKEAERESLEQNLNFYSSPQDRNKRQDMRNSMDGRKRGPDSFGWMTVTNSQPNKSRLVVESSKLKLEQSDVEVASTLSLGNRHQFMWGPNASSGKMDDKKPLSQFGSNKFAVLSPSSTGNSSLKGSASIEVDRINSYKSTEDDVVLSKSRSQQSDANSRSSSRESASSKRDDNRFIGTGNNNNNNNNKAQSSSAATPASSEEDQQQATKLILFDYLCSADVNEAINDLQKTFTPETMSEFVSMIICQIMEETGSKNTKTVGRLLHQLMSANVVTKQDFLVGLSKVLETGDDLSIDMPLVWQYLAEIIVEMCADDVISFKDIAEALAPIKYTRGCAKFLASLVKLLFETKKESWVEQRWLDSQLSLSDLIDEKAVNDFVKQNKVDFMLGKKSIKYILSQMIAEKASFDEITMWVSENVGEEKCSQPQFVRTLMTALLEVAVTKGQSTYKLDPEVLSRYEQLILRYTNHKEALELPCLFAIQAFLHKLEHPQTILHSVFNFLWDSSLIATESFRLWRDSDNPQENEGHAVCVTSLTSFFTHLSETETDDES